MVVLAVQTTLRAHSGRQERLCWVMLLVLVHMQTPDVLRNMKIIISTAANEKILDSMTSFRNKLMETRLVTNPGPGTRTGLAIGSDRIPSGYME